jgi:hypothetical protein
MAACQGCMRRSQGEHSDPIPLAWDFVEPLVVVHHWEENGKGPVLELLMDCSWVEGKHTHSAEEARMVGAGCRSADQEEGLVVGIRIALESRHCSSRQNVV